MRASILTLLLAAVLLAGCGGSGKSAKPNGEASKSATQVFSDAKQALLKAGSFHVTGRVVADGMPLELDLTIASGKGAKGTMSANGLGFDLVEIGDKVYIKGSDAFYKKFAGSAFVPLLHGKWVQGSTTMTQLRPLAAVANTRALVAAVSASHGKLVNDGETTYSGQQVVEVTNDATGDKLYVSATGTPYPVAFVGGKKSGGTVTFDRWNEPVSLSAPSNAIDISQFAG